MKQEYKKKLLVVFDTICYNLGSTIGWHTRPTLYFSHKEYEKHLKAFEEGGGWVSKPDEETPYGETVWNAKAIYVNPTDCVYMHENGHAIKCENVVRGYSDHLYVLIHELVHWYFPSLEHGFEFEKKIGELFKMIPIKEVYSHKVASKEAIRISCPICMCLVRLYCDPEKDKVYALTEVERREKKKEEYPCDCYSVLGFYKK